MFLTRSIQYSVRRMSSHFNIKDLPKHKSLVIDKYGDPMESVKFQECDPTDILPSQIKPNQVLVQHLAAPVNPADINVIQGVYGIKPALPTVLGNEGTGKVLHIGDNVKNLTVGDHVIFTTSFSRTWQSYSLVTDNQLQAIDKKLDLDVAAQLKVNPCTAYLLLKNYVSLQTNEPFIQNGANSACGVFIIQLARAWGLKSINVIRDRPNKDELIDELKGYGADIVLTDTEISRRDVIESIVKEFGKPRLALNCVGGKIASDCSKLLADGGYFVTYGAMSKKRVELSAAHIFKNLKYYPHWSSRDLDEMRTSRPDEMASLFSYLSEMFLNGQLKSKLTTRLDLADYKTAFDGMINSTGTKYVLLMNK